MTIDQSLLAAYEAQAGILSDAIAGLSRENLNAHPVAGTWSIGEIVLHILDSDLIATHRVKRIIAEECPLLISYDENAFVKHLFYDQADVARAAELFRINRLHTAEILKRIAPDAWNRAGVHSQVGKITVRDNVDKYVHHVRHHMKFLVDKRKMIGKALAIAVP